MNIKGLNKQFCFTGHRVESIVFGSLTVQVNLVHDKRFKLRCTDCEGDGFVEQEEERDARDLPFGAARLVYVYYTARKFRCRRCGKREWRTPVEIDAKRGACKRFMLYASALMQHMPVSRTSQFVNVSDTRLRNWDKAVLKQQLGEVCLDDLELLLVDEKSIGKGHQYITVVLNGETGELLHCHEGKKKESLMAFFDKLSEAQKASIRAVCLDRGGAYVACVEEAVPHAAIAFDRFHLVMNLNEVVSKIRKDEQRKLKEEGKKKDADWIKGQRYNLLRRREKNTTDQENRLATMLDKNQPLHIAYLLLDDFRDALSQRYIGAARSALSSWVDAAVTCGVERLEKFAMRIFKSTDRIVNATRYGLTNGMIEGFNNLISRISHRGCGYKDLEYFELKLRQAATPPDLMVS